MSGFKDLPEDLIKAVSQIIAETDKAEKQEDEVIEGEDDETPAHDADCACEGCLDVDSDKETVEENVAIAPSELASSEPNSAIGHIEPGSEPPKHVDVVRETDMRPIAADGTKVEGFRLLLQYSTNRRVEFVPSLDLPAAPDIDSLVALIPGSTEVVDAVLKALDLPSNRPQYSGSANEEVKKKLAENVIDAEGLATELELMAMNNYPKEWGAKDLNGLINKLVSDVKQMGSTELRHEIEDALPEIKKALQAAWREEKRGR